MFLHYVNFVLDY